MRAQRRRTINELLVGKRFDLGMIQWVRGFFERNLHDILAGIDERRKHGSVRRDGGFQ